MTIHTAERLEQEHLSEVNRGYAVGFWSALIGTGIGIIYFLALLGLILTGEFTMPLSEPVQLFGGIITLLVAPIIVVILAGLHAVTPPKKQVFSLTGLGFTLLFALSVSINRFAQLGVVRQSLAAGNTEGIGWFLAYGDRSIMFTLEILGWAWFLGLGMLWAAPLFGGSRLEAWIRGLMLAYAGLGLICSVAFLLGSPLAAIGFAAWGGVLFVVTGLLAVYFNMGMKID